MAGVTIVSLKKTRPTGEAGDDSVWVADLSEDGEDPERFHFSLARRHGNPNDNDMRRMISEYLAGVMVEHGESVLAALRERAQQRGSEPDRDVIAL